MVGTSGSFHGPAAAMTAFAVNVPADVSTVHRLLCSLQWARCISVPNFTCAGTPCSAAVRSMYRRISSCPANNRDHSRLGANE